MNAKIFYILLTFLLFPFTAVRAGEVRLSPGDSQAIMDAVSKFRDDGYPDGRYELIVRNNESTIEIVFLPDPVDDLDPWKAMPSHLREVHYYFDKSGGKFLRKLLGK